ncbi:hypothetical protein CHARACLAT_032904 [Characodon lateralis]|uniref:Uncharacterized protein n=1 Tax=Characodon lateralis TaxID=208331 RepID=A0ABU7EPF4_9TELE|nr:hypothetical protein [Characodon lateralis]
MSRDSSPLSPFSACSPGCAFWPGSEALALLPPQETPAWSTFLWFSWRGGGFPASLLRAAASKPASLSATALSARLAAPLPMPSALAPARCSEATPDELEQRLRFYASQIKSLRKTCLMYSSLELMERIRQMERDYETAVRQFYCRRPLPTPCLQDNAAAQSTSCLQNGGAAAAEQPTSGPQPDTPQPDSRPDTPQPGMTPDPKSASTPSTWRRGRRKRDGSSQWGPRRHLGSCH